MDLNDFVRFFAKVNTSESCWEWSGSLDSGGYGLFRLEGKMEKAHRVSYLWFVKEPQEGQHICHACDNPKCVNPKHLWAGTPSDNAIDRESKGRGRDAKGENNPFSKLKEDDVIFIKRHHRKGDPNMNCGALAKRFGCGESTVQAIVCGRNWGWLNV